MSEDKRRAHKRKNMPGAVGGIVTSAEKEDFETGEIPKKTSRKEAKYIKVRVLEHSGSGGIHFRLKMTTPLIKLKRAYSTHKDIHLGYLRFLFDGRRISDDDTPQKLDMKDDDQIEVYQEQIGGFSFLY